MKNVVKFEKEDFIIVDQNAAKTCLERIDSRLLKNSILDHINKNKITYNQHEFIMDVIVHAVNQDIEKRKKV